MGFDEAMPDTPYIKIQEARCKEKNCGMLLARLWLVGTSRVEIKCRRGKCGDITIFTANDGEDLKPDGQGGFNQ